MYFKEFVHELANRHGLVKEIDGTQVSLKIVLPGGLLAQITCDAVDSDRRAYVRSSPFKAPITRDGHDRFMEFLLEFNRHSTAHLDVGIAPLPHDDSSFTPTWFVSKREYDYEDWVQLLDVYEALSIIAHEGVQKVMSQWIKSLH